MQFHAPSRLLRSQRAEDPRGLDVIGFLRMSFITDLLTLMKSTFINHEQYMEAHSKANYFINLGLKDWFEKTVELISEIAQVELDILYAFIDSIVFTETMCYSQIGRPETILINLE